MKQFLHVNSMFISRLVKRKLKKANENLQLMSKSVYTKNNAQTEADKAAGAVKVCTEDSDTTWST